VSENITHTGILDDCFRLMLASEEICDAFKQSVREKKDFARLGGITRSGDRFTVQLLTEFRDRWEGRSPDDNLEAKLGFVLGWLTHGAADRQMKPFFREAEPDRTQSPSDCSVYHDALVFREVFALGKESPYSVATFDRNVSALPAAKGLDVSDVEDFFQALLQRALIGLHTFIPDRDDIEAWLDKLAKLRQQFDVDLERYAKAVAEPDPQKVQRFIVEMNFYDREDSIILAARKIQRGESVSSADVVTAVEADAGSHYGQAIQMGYGYLKAASDFFTSDSDPEDLRNQLDIGKPGRDGKGV